MAPAPYIMYGKWALEVLDHEVPKIGESIKQLIKNWKFGPMKLKKIGQSINLLFILLALFQLIGIFLVWQGYTPLSELDRNSG